MFDAVLIHSTRHDHHVVTLPLDPARLEEVAAELLDCRAVELGAVLDNGDKIYVDPRAIYTATHFFLHRKVGVPLPGSALLVPKHGPASAQAARDLVIFMEREDALGIIATPLPGLASPKLAEAA